MYKNCVFICTIALALFFQSCGSPDISAEQNKKVQPAKLVKVQPLQKRTLIEKLELPGTIQPENVANVLSTTEGKISQLMVREGDRIHKDQVLARISSLLREDIINSARLLVQSQKEMLNKNPGDPALEKALQQAEEDYRFATQQYKEIAVTAPMSGVLAKRWVDMGDMISAKAHLFEIQSSAKLRVDVPVSEIDLRKLRNGQTADILADACPDKIFKGRIQRIYPQVDASTRNGLVELTLLDPCINLKVGMFVRATFITRTLKDVNAIPVPAIIDRPNNKTCFIIKENNAQEKILHTGLEAEGWVQVVSGLNEGDQVVIEGQHQLISGMPVKIQGQKNGAKGEGGGN